MRILFLSAWFPYPPLNGAKIRIFNLIRQLAPHHDITLVSLARTIGVQEARSHIPLLTEYCRSVDVVAAKPFAPSSLSARLGFLSPIPRHIVQTYNNGMAKLVEERTRACSYDVIVASEVTAPSVVSLLASKVAGMPKVLDALEVGLMKDAYSSQTSPIRRVRHGLTWFKLRQFTKGLVEQASLCTVPSYEEKQNLLDIAPTRARIEVVPHCLDLAYYTGAFGVPEPRSLVFTGSFTYHANLDAARFFLEDIYPHIKARVTDASLKIVGSTDGVALDAWPKDATVTFTGLLRDVRPTIAQSWLSVAPLRVGSGTRLKIIESMALGTPVVSTSKGAEGLEVTHGENILIADDPGLFARAVVDVLRDPALHARLSAGGRALVSAKYNAEVVGQQFARLLERYVPGKQ
ncbi:MAG TPA: hypothetical protein DEP84_06555 [Chloroflexi bacterium]|nr:hypothetical protein [Chloroflexota bacterium]